MQVLDWFMAPQQAARFTCDGELNYTLKGLTPQGWCDEYTLQERQGMGDQWTQKVNDAQDITAYGGLWLPLSGTAVRPWLLNTMPPDMKAHFDQVLKGRYSPMALQAADYAAKYVKTTSVRSRSCSRTVQSGIVLDQRPGIDAHRVLIGDLRS